MKQNEMGRQGEGANLK